MKLIQLLESGLLKPGQELIWNRRTSGETHIAIVSADGYITTADGKSHKTPSGAAKHLNGNRPIDGWIAWKLKANKISLADLRSKFLEI